jgi:hypothetical protein
MLEKSSSGRLVEARHEPRRSATVKSSLEIFRKGLVSRDPEVKEVFLSND